MSICWCVIDSTPNGASSGQFPEHQPEWVHICPLEWLKAVRIDRLIQDFRGHVPAEDKVITAKWNKKVSASTTLNRFEWVCFLLSFSYQHSVNIKDFQTLCQWALKSQLQDLYKPNGRDIDQLLRLFSGSESASVMTKHITHLSRSKISVFLMTFVIPASVLLSGTEYLNNSWLFFFSIFTSDLQKRCPFHCWTVDISNYSANM